MPTVKHILEQRLSAQLAAVTGVKAQANVITASRPEFGDYQANGVMAVARQQKTNPRELAQKIVDALLADGPDKEGLVERYEVAGPGFINIFLADKWLDTRLQQLQVNTDALLPDTDRPQSIVVDYSSPNLAKEMHVGHLRGTIIGDCLARVQERLGHHVIRQNHVGDWGTQFGMLITYMQQIMVGNNSLPTALADLESFYRAAKEQFDHDPEFAERARASVVKLQAGAPEYTEIWRRFIEESLRHCEAVYERLRITLTRDDLRPESFYNADLGEIVQLLDDRELLTVSDGARCVFLPEFTGKDDNPLPVIVQKSDGGYLYSTTDLAAIRFRCGTLAADRILYVVDVRQSLHFQQIFAVARRAGLASEACALEHISYGTMMGTDGKPFKTRSGGLVKLIELLDEAERRAFELVTSKNPGLEESRRRHIGRTVGMAAVKYADLSKNRSSDYVFDWSSMLSFEGNTAPYMLYAYARIKSILRKQDGMISVEARLRITAPEERELALKILQFPETVELVARECYPNHLCSALYELAGSFMRFYEACPVLKAEASVRDSRLLLAGITAETLRLGLELLGIETLEQM